MGKRGPTAFSPDWDQVDKMAAIHCTGEEMAGILGVEYKTLERACKREKKTKLGEYIKQKASTGKMSLRRKQYTTAMDGNPTMLVWLGKNWLGQKDKSDEEIEASKENTLADALKELAQARHE